jgi:YD repeat-containing protein
MSYNSFGEMTASNLKRNALSISEMAMTRDALGRISRRTEKLDGKIRDLSFAYDKSGRLVSVKKSQGRVLREYIYDDNGNRVEKIEKGQHIRAQYDAQDRLLSYGSFTFKYNAAGELIEKSELVRGKGHNSEHYERAHHDDHDRNGRYDDDDDHEGHIRHHHNHVNQDQVKKTSYSYDIFGNLIKVTLPDQKVVEYVLDSQNRRVGEGVLS